MADDPAVAGAVAAEVGGERFAAGVDDGMMVVHLADNGADGAQRALLLDGKADRQRGDVVEDIVAAADLGDALEVFAAARGIGVAAAEHVHAVAFGAQQLCRADKLIMLPLRLGLVALACCLGIDQAAVIHQAADFETGQIADGVRKGDGLPRRAGHHRGAVHRLSR